MKTYAFKQLRPGMRIVMPDTDFSEPRILAYAELMDAKHPIHVNEAYARTTVFGRRIAHGPFAMAASLAALGRIFHDNLIALLDVGTWQFMRPIFLGDALQTEGFVLKLDRSRGVVWMEIRIYDPDGQLAQRGETSLLLTRPD